MRKESTLPKLQRRKRVVLIPETPSGLFSMEFI